MAVAYEQTFPVAASGRPLDWRKDRWRAFLVLNGGGTASDAAAVSGVGRRSIAEWLRLWRLRFGDDILGLPSGTAIERARHHRTASVAEQRLRLLNNVGVNVEKGTRVIGLALSKYLNSPDLVRALDPSDLEKIAKTVKLQAEIYGAVAHAITDESQPFPARGNQKPELPSENVLEALEPGEDGEIDDIMAGLEEAHRHLHVVDEDEEEVITVESRLVS